MAVVYLDHHATTPCDPRVVDRMLPFFTQTFGNPAAIASHHGREAARAVEEARSRIAAILGVGPSEVIFTSGATESNHLALTAVSPGAHVVTTALEHPSVLEPLGALASRGVTVRRVQPGSDGVVDPAAIRDAITPATRLVSVIAASGEIGTIQPVEEIADICSTHGILFHTDATQAVGKIRWSLPCAGAQLVSGSAHKFYGPKGVGFLVARRGVRLEPWTRGGGQERGLRSGTLNVPAIVGMAEALAIREREQDGEARRLIDVREAAIGQITGMLADAVLLGHRQRRLPGNIALRIPGIDADSIILAMKRFSLSAGSACSARQRGPAPALLGIGMSESECVEAFRVGMGSSTTSNDMGLFATELQRVVHALRA